MIKKISIILLCMVLIMSLPVGTKAYADGFDAEVVASYRSDGTLISFVETDMNGIDKFKGSTSELGGSLIEPERFVQSGAGASYIVLLDASVSMEEYAEASRSFVSALAATKNYSARVLVVPYTKQILTDKIIDSAKLSGEDVSAAMGEAFDAIGFTDADNLSCKSVESLLAMLESELPAKSGDLVNLVLVTDNMDDAGYTSPALKSAREKLGAHPEVLFHSVLIDRADGTKRFDGKGISLSMNNKSSGEEAAKQLSDYVSKLYRISIPWTAKDSQSERESVEWFMQYWLSGENNSVASKTVSMDNVALLQSYEDGSGMYVSGHEKTAESQNESPAAPAVTEEPLPAAAAPETAGNSAEAESTENSEAAAPAEGEATENPEAAESDEAAAEEGSEEAEAEEPAADEAFCFDISDNMLLIAIGAFAAVILVVIIIVLAKGKKKKKTGSSGFTIYMQLEVLSGKCKSKQREFELSDEIVIGRGRKCDVVFVDADVSENNTRVFIKDGFVYIDDLSSARGTSIEGMRIYSPNRLRSGNEISIGNVRFRFNF